MRTLEKGKIYRITAINEKDAFYWMKDSLIGQKACYIEGIGFPGYATGNQCGGHFELLTGPKKGKKYFFAAINARKVKHQDEEVCTCSAYSHPHRQGAGKCEKGPFYYCGSCGKPCSINVRRENFLDKAYSRCCNAKVFCNQDLTKPFYPS